MTEEEAARVVDTLFESWYAALVRYASRWTSAPAPAEDLVQDTFMQLYRALREGQAVANPRAWTLFVLRRAIGRHYREIKRRGGDWQPLEEAEAFGLLPPVQPDTDSMHADLSRLLTVLTPREEEVLLLRLQALKYREIAAHLGISANSVNTLLARALKKMAHAQRPAEPQRAAPLDEDDVDDVPDTLH